MYLSNCWAQGHRPQRLHLAEGSVMHPDTRLVGSSSLFSHSLCPPSSLHIPSPTWLLCTKGMAGPATPPPASTLLSRPLCLAVCHCCPFSQVCFSPESFTPYLHDSFHVLLSIYLTSFGGAFQLSILTFHIACSLLKRISFCVFLWSIKSSICDRCGGRQLFIINSSIWHVYVG